MSRWCAERTTAEALEILAKAKIPSGPVLKPQQTLDDPHIQAMGFFQPTEFPGAPQARADRQGARVAVGDARLRSAAARRRWASTPTRSWPSSATTRRRSPSCARRA